MLILGKDINYKKMMGDGEVRIQQAKLHKNQTKLFL